MAAQKLAAVKEVEVTEAEAAKGEVLDGDRSFDWHGLMVHVPSKLPVAALFDQVEGIAEDDGGIAQMRMIYNIVGKEQWKLIRNHGVEKELTEETFTQLLEGVMKALGTTGEQPSPSSDS